MDTQACTAREGRDSQGLYETGKYALHLAQECKLQMSGLIRVLWQNCNKAIQVMVACIEKRKSYLFGIFLGFQEA